MNELFMGLFAISFIGVALILWLDHLIFHAEESGRIRKERELSFTYPNRSSDFTLNMFIPGLVLLLFPYCVIAFVCSLLDLRRMKRIDYSPAMNTIVKVLERYEKSHERFEAKKYHDQFTYQYEPNPQQHYSDAYSVIEANKLRMFAEAVELLETHRYTEQAKKICEQYKKDFSYIVEVFDEKEYLLKDQEKETLEKMDRIVGSFTNQVQKTKFGQQENDTYSHNYSS